MNWIKVIMKNIIETFDKTTQNILIELEKTQKEFLGVIASEARRMAKLVTDLLELSRIDNNKNNYQLDSYFFFNILFLSSKSGGYISTGNPQQNLVFSLSSNICKSSGERSLEIIICLVS